MFLDVDCMLFQKNTANDDVMQPPIFINVANLMHIEILDYDGLSCREVEPQLAYMEFAGFTRNFQESF